jgi:hypothetical protein
METRHQVFVSSTYVDLVEERREVMQALLELDCIPAGMELFPAANEEQWELIRSVIDQSDYYVVIVGGRYGSLSEDGLSYTEREYDYAVEQGIPVAGFVHKDPGSIPRDKSDVDPKLWKRLEKFREKVQSRMMKYYSDPSSLGGAVSRSMVAQMKHHPRPGWVRGDEVVTPELREEVAQLRARLAERERDAAVATRAGSAEPDSGLAQGADTLDVTFSYEADDPYDDNVYTDTLEMTWDAILRAVGPRMIDESPEHEIRAALAEAVREAVKSQGGSAVDSRSVDVEDSDWNQILMQLRALGYVALGVRKRALTDRWTYWKLTEAGDAALVSLLAARRV